MFAAALGVLCLGACSAAPDNLNRGRIDPSESTEAEENSSQLQITAITAAGNRIPQQLAQDLLQFPPIRDSKYRIIVVMGDLNNKCPSVSSNDFEALRTTIRSNLMQSQFIRDRVMFVESRARMDALRAREGVAGGGAPAYDPAYTYTLNGDFYQISRAATDKGEANQYLMRFNLVNFQTGELFSVGQPYVVKQWHD
jgi:hypothetical protein